MGVTGARIKDRAHAMCPAPLRRLRRSLKAWWLACAFSAAGFLALVWFLVRVLPKPSRATYPCQRAAFPLASSFVVWVMALLGSAFAWRQFKQRHARLWQPPANVPLPEREPAEHFAGCTRQRYVWEIMVIHFPLCAGFTARRRMR